MKTFLVVAHKTNDAICYDGDIDYYLVSAKDHTIISLMPIFKKYARIVIKETALLLRDQNPYEIV